MQSDEAEQFAIGLAAALFGNGRGVLARSAHQAAQLLQVAVRILGGPARQRRRRRRSARRANARPGAAPASRGHGRAASRRPLRAAVRHRRRASACRCTASADAGLRACGCGRSRGSHRAGSRACRARRGGCRAARPAPAPSACRSCDACLRRVLLGRLPKASSSLPSAGASRDGGVVLAFAHCRGAWAGTWTVWTSGRGRRTKGSVS